MVNGLFQLFTQVALVVLTYVCSTRFGAREFRKLYGEKNLAAKKEIAILLFLTERDAIKSLSKAISRMVMSTYDLFPCMERVCKDPEKKSDFLREKFCRAHVELLEAQSVLWESQPFIEASLHAEAERLLDACSLQQEAYRLHVLGEGCLRDSQVSSAYEKSQQILESYRSWASLVREHWNKTSFQIKNSMAEGG